MSAEHLKLGPDERLKLLQMLEIQSWSDDLASLGNNSQSVKALTVQEIPSRWNLTQGISLRDWQKHAVDRWFNAGKRGVAKVVTGAGKTTLALAITERLYAEDSELRLVVVVPTVVLLHQWRHQILSNSNIPENAIGMLGGGANDTFDGKRILLCVLNSASRKLPALVRDAGIENHLLLVVDECHRAGATEMRKLFDTPRSYVLGLSATPERDDGLGEDGIEAVDIESEETAAAPVLEVEIGPVFFELNYAEAISEGILPPFTIEHYGLSLSADESRSYSAISQEITDLRRQLETRSRRGLALIRWCRSAAGARDARAQRLISLIVDRKRLLYGMEERSRAVKKLLSESILRDPDARVIIFHESISGVMKLFGDLRYAGFRVVAEHSRLPERLRTQAIGLFREGTAQVIVSAKSLIEGFNVPSADIGIIVAASSSVRQRIQTLGRLLRKRESIGEEKQARLIVLYATNTVDEIIYEKADWNSFVGAEKNRYFKWTAVDSSAPSLLMEPPRAYVPEDHQIDPRLLVVGGEYSGKLDGRMFSVDTGGTVSDDAGLPVAITNDLALKLREFSSGGRFIVTPREFHMVRLLNKEANASSTYLGKLDALPRKAQGSTDEEIRPEVGEEYPLHLANGKMFSVLQRDRRLIALKQRGKVLFVKPADLLIDEVKRRKLVSIQQALTRAYSSGRHMSKLFVNSLGHAGYLHNGRAYFLGDAPEGMDGFVFDDYV